MCSAWKSRACCGACPIPWNFCSAPISTWKAAIWTCATSEEPSDGRAPARLLQPRAGVHARDGRRIRPDEPQGRSEEHTSELQSLMRISYAVFCLKKKQRKKKK